MIFTSLLKHGLVLVVLAILLLAHPSVSLAGDSSAASAVLSACMNQGVKIDLCERVQVASQEVESIAKNLISDLGISPAYGAIVVSSSQMIARRELTLKTSIYGVKSDVHFSKDLINVALHWNF